MPELLNIEWIPRETYTTGLEEETLQFGELGRSNSEQSCISVQDASGGRFVGGEGISGNKNESSTWMI